VIEVGSADIMATLLNLKAEVENKLGSKMRMVFAGASEAYLLAKEISKAITLARRQVLTGPMKRRQQLVSS
jgi:hypothetical protein